MLQEKINEWLRLDKNDHTINEINNLIANNDKKCLESLLLTRMTFGTAGLRAKMGPGFSQMNDLTIIQTSQGLAAYCEQSLGEKVKHGGVVVGFDGRHNSRRWAITVAQIFASRGIPVAYFKCLVPTPFVPFYIRQCGAVCGVMVTASHNPKQDNGYKVYWENGCQIVPPHDAGIAECIEANLEPWSGSWPKDDFPTSPQVRDVFDEVVCKYFVAQVERLCLTNAPTFPKSPISVVYTAMHGVGWPFARRALESMDFVTVIPVPEQIESDPEFPTVTLPNPEEGRSALDFSIICADKNQVSWIFANDPDADRLAVAEKQLEGWRIFNGNELAALIGWWLLFTYSGDKSNLVMISSTVSSRILQRMARKDGFHFEETLTGFKWMGNSAKTHEMAGRKVLFAFEEAIGFMCGDLVLDKDGISALLCVAQICSHVKANDSSLAQQLETIYDLYGTCVSNNGYFISQSQEDTNKMFHRLQHWPNDAYSIEGPNKNVRYPSECGGFKISHVRDLNLGFDTHYEDKLPRLPVSSSSQMLTFDFDNDVQVTIRTSGTEPKIKWYSELCADTPFKESHVALQARLDAVIAAVVGEFYQPEVYGFRPMAH